MQTKTFDIIKKNRVYFSARSGGFPCKIKITDASRDLDVGQHTLAVDDVSVRTKFGIDLIFEVKGEIKKEDSICTLQHYAYNSILITACRNLGGRWDKQAVAWSFPSFVEDKVAELDELYNTDIVSVEITAMETRNVLQNSVRFCGYSIAFAKGRDSGAELSKGVACLAGRYTSGGSYKNWTTVIEKGAVFRLKVPRKLFYGIENKYWTVQLID